MIDVKDSHQENAPSPIDVTEFGMEIDVKDSQEEKASSPIEVTEFGIVIDVKDEQAAKASSPIEVTEFGIVIDIGIYLSNDAIIIVLSLLYIIPFSIMKFWPIDMFAGFNLLHP